MIPNRVTLQICKHSSLNYLSNSYKADQLLRVLLKTQNKAPKQNKNPTKPPQKLKKASGFKNVIINNFNMLPIKYYRATQD